MENILIKNATIVDSGQTIQADVFIKDGIIEKIDSSISLSPGTKLIMADNQYILPGVIDTHVHFREPGMTNKATFASESTAAVAGGVTTVVDMPNTIPSATTPELVENKFAIAEKSSLVNYSFMIGATDKNIDDILRLDPRRIAAVKVFLGSSTGNLCIKEPSAIEKIFVSSPILIAAHCEDDEIIKENLSRVKAEYGDNIPSYMHSEIRSEESCFKSSQYAVELAKKTGARLHLLHISTKKELSLLQNIAYNSTKKITGEACIHHLFFNQTDYSSKDNLIKVNPSIKTKEDQEALWDALLSGCLDTIATDHAPHTLEEKKQPYLSCPSGGPMIQHSLPAMLGEVAKGRISLPEVVEKMSHNPARLFGMEHRGYVREGYHADLAIVEFNAPWRVHHEGILYQCGWSAFNGKMFPARINTTIVGGQIAFSNGKPHAHTGAKAIVFER